MRAILPKTETSNAMQPQNKETVETITVIGCKKNVMRELVVARYYMGRSNSASVVYCRIWIHGNIWFSGKGQAGGYGYHKSSAAFQSALTSAGVKLVGNPYKGIEKTYIQHERQEDGTYKQVKYQQDFTKECSISGCGSTAVDDALKAIAYELGYKNILIVRG